jgi:uncharacterized SAM-binding protein YcdF (DUF218 family)
MTEADTDDGPGTHLAPAVPDGGAGDDVVDARARRRRRRRRILLGIVGIPLLVLLYLAATFVQVWQASRHDGARKAEAIVVMGAAQYNGRASPALQNRLDHALALYRRGLAPLVVVTGGRQTGDRYTEATVGYDFLRRNGVPDRAIRKEVQGRTTYESLASVRRFLRKEGLDDVVLVGGPATAERLAGIADDLGLRAAVSPSPGRPGLGQLMKETAGVAVGRIIGYRRLERLDH